MEELTLEVPLYHLSVFNELKEHIENLRENYVNRCSSQTTYLPIYPGKRLAMIIHTLGFTRPSFTKRLKDFPGCKLNTS